MKIFKTAFLGIAFLCGLTAFSINEPVKTSEEIVINEVPCADVYTVCDRAHPSDYSEFDDCMQANGCG